MLKTINLILYIISILLSILSVALLVKGVQPCSGDGCMIRFLFIFGVALFLISAFIFYVTKRNMNKLKNKKQE